MPVSKIDKKKNVLYIVIVILVIVLMIVVVALLRVMLPGANTQEYVEMNMPDIGGNYRVGTDFVLRNTLEIDTELQNTLFKHSGAVNPSPYRQVAQKLALSKESSNEYTGLYFWNTQDEDPYRYMNINVKTGTLELRYRGGFHEDTLEVDEVYAYIQDFFRVELYDVYLDKTVESGNTQTLLFKATHEDKTVYTKPGADTFGVVTLINGKITSIVLHGLMPQEFELVGELEPVEEISPSAIARLQYLLYVYPDQASSQSSMGAEAIASGRVDINMTGYSQALLFFQDSVAGESYLLPSLEITGRYLDEKNNGGTVKIIVVNKLSETETI